MRVLLVEERPVAKAVLRRLAASVEVPFESDAATLAAAVAPHLDGHLPGCIVAAGERGVLAAANLRTALGLPGTTPDIARRARDKVLMKRAARAAGVPCTDWVELTSKTRAVDVVTHLGLPAVFKLRAGAGGRGLQVAHSWTDVQRCLRSIDAVAREHWMAERYISGQEMSIESFVVDGRVVFTNPTEYFVVAYANIGPAALGPAELAPLLDLNARAIAALGIERGMTHLELYRTAEGPLFGEVAIRPPGGRIMRLLRRAYGFDPWEALMRVERGEQFVFPDRARCTAGVWMLHPGAGRVRRVGGFDAARRVKGVRKLVFRLEVGKDVGPRESTGSDTGWIEVSGRSRAEVAEILCRARHHLHVEMEPPEG